MSSENVVMSEAEMDNEPGNVTPPQIPEEPSFTNPSWDFLNGIKKPELQIRCRELGINKIFVTKDKLIQMIMEKHNLSRLSGSESSEVQEGISICKCTSDVNKLKDQIKTKDQEIEDLREMLKSSHVSINKLSDRLSLIEEQIMRLPTGVEPSTSQREETIPSPPPKERILLLGDTNLSCALASDMDSHCSIRTIRGANIDLVKCWVTEKLHWVPTKCILYCGLQDILNNVPTLDIFENLDSLVINLKEINEAMEISICQLAPTLMVEKYDDKINDYNNKLVKWSSDNGISHIETNLRFRLGTGDIDDMCYENDGESPGLFLNRFGILRLLSAISKQCTYFNLQNKLSNKIGDHGSDPSNKNSFNNVKRGMGSNNIYTNSYANVGRGQNYATGSEGGWRRDSGTYRRPDNLSNHRSHHGPSPSSHSHSHPYRNNWHDSHRPFNHSHRDQGYSGLQSQDRSRDWDRGFGRSQGQVYGRGCYNCGEHNHQQSNCRYDHKIRCASCQSLGHKSKLCSLYGN